MDLDEAVEQNKRLASESMQNIANKFLKKTNYGNDDDDDEDDSGADENLPKK